MSNESLPPIGAGVGLPYGLPSFRFRRRPDRVANWRSLIRWILLIPHFMILAVFHLVAWLLAILTMLAILITGKLPAGIANFQTMYIRYYPRVLSFVHVIHHQYPPFSVAE
ncbi:DUF4389 domain-containing protein [Candidatus Poriferisodalis sp.]|uniref:DUF4389 domain-containing protein n=1 Tax=Candidatus Poriferisodalis sp. TaxID=3101277 RepID=UPI003B0209CC